MSYKVVSLGMGIGADDCEVFLIVPHWVTAEEIMAAEMDEEGSYECVCECYSSEAAGMIVNLLNLNETLGSC